MTLREISESYSADRIAEGAPIRKPFGFGGSIWISTGGHGTGQGGMTWEAYRLQPVSAFSGTAHTYGENLQPDQGETARTRPEGFYHGITVKHGSTPHVLCGPKQVFSADDCDASLFGDDVDLRASEPDDEPEEDGDFEDDEEGELAAEHEGICTDVRCGLPMNHEGPCLEDEDEQDDYQPMSAADVLSGKVDYWATVAPPIPVAADPERGPRLDAERVTFEFASRSPKRADCGQMPMSQSPLFGGPAQGSLFG